MVRCWYVYAEPHAPRKRVWLAHVSSRGMMILALTLILTLTLTMTLTLTLTLSSLNLSSLTLTQTLVTSHLNHDHVPDPNHVPKPLLTLTLIERRGANGLIPSLRFVGYPQMRSSLQGWR